jgi:hypothetical protein
VGPERTTEAVCCLYCEKMDHYNCLITFEQNLFLFFGYPECYSCLVREEAEWIRTLDGEFQDALASFLEEFQFTELVEKSSVEIYKRLGFNPLALLPDDYPKIQYRFSLLLAPRYWTLDRVKELLARGETANQCLKRQFWRRMTKKIIGPVLQRRS